MSLSHAAIDPRDDDVATALKALTVDVRGVAQKTYDDLAGILMLSDDPIRRREQAAPFAPVWAAMIALQAGASMTGNLGDLAKLLNE